ncbi:hypothetical protein Cni_G08524 [Canna indica]|uniref:ABC1 atypical kinase-like domain-containing protein n=1 Tax=Canna indica TaxID=4628 RepID=A0AAQ3K316_9LILI|nr:hypothetical protein Cni_G08524 [Canna indica]
MTAVLATNSCYKKLLEPINRGQGLEDFSFSGSIYDLKFVKFGAPVNDSSAKNKLPRVLAVQQAATDRYGTNGRATKMVSTKELVTRKDSSDKKKSSPADNSKIAVNGASMIRRNSTSALVTTEIKTKPKVSPVIDDLKILPSDEGFSWAKDNYNSWQRTIDIWSFVLSLRLRVLFDNAKWAYIDGFTEDKQKTRRKKTASWLREQVLQLGPTFIKLGQLSSTRSDLFPREFVDELAKLQDRVPAFSPEKAKAFVKSELGCPIEVLFKEFEDRPIAAASLGQVHRAVLHSGERVAVKIQRPGLKKLFDIDLRIGYTLDPDFSFVKIAAPYAQELLDIRQKQRGGVQLVQEIRKQANDARDYTISMPYRIQRIEEFMKQLESGDLKLRVRVLESERAARKASILQMATMYTAFSGTLLNVGVTLSSQGNQTIASGTFIGAGVFLALVLRSMQRIKKLDKFEKMI